MSTRSDVTVNAVSRTYEPKWHARYSDEIGKGNTSCEVCDIPDGESIIRRTHSVSKSGIEKHYESIEDLTIDANGKTHIVKIGVTVTFTSGDVADEAAAELLAEGYLANVGSATELNSFISGELRK